jgi:hemicentin
MKPVDVNVGRHVTSLSRVNITLNCSSRGVPPPRIEWMNGGKILDVVGPMLSLKNVSRTDSGKYTCVASNVAGKANASTVINVTGSMRGINLEINLRSGMDR